MKDLISVSGLEDQGLEVYTRLSEVQLKHYYEPNGGLFIAESPKVVMRALDAGCIPVSLLVEDRHVRGEAAEVIARCRRCCEEIPVYAGRYEVLTKLTGYALTRGVLCAMRRPTLRTAEDILDGEGDAFHRILNGDSDSGQGRPGRARRIAVLENVMNPANVGSIFRNAAALGIDAVLLTDGCSDPLYRRTLRVSMGTVLRIPWAWIRGSLEDWGSSGLRLLKERGYRTIAMALREDAVGIGDLRLGKEEKAAVILGAEGDGLLPGTISAADSVVMIPMARGVDSLNVAAASAVSFYVFGSYSSGREEEK